MASKAHLAEFKQRHAPDKDLVSYLEKLLEGAKAGKLTAVGFAEVWADDLERGADTKAWWIGTEYTGRALDSAISQLQIQYYVTKYLNRT
jgi:hypothetical protein